MDSRHLPNDYKQLKHTDCLSHPSCFGEQSGSAGSYNFSSSIDSNLSNWNKPKISSLDSQNIPIQLSPLVLPLGPMHIPYNQNYSIQDSFLNQRNYDVSSSIQQSTVSNSHYYPYSPNSDIPNPHSVENYLYSFTDSYHSSPCYLENSPISPSDSQRINSSDRIKETPLYSLKSPILPLAIKKKSPIEVISRYPNFPLKRHAAEVQKFYNVYPQVFNNELFCSPRHIITNQSSLKNGDADASADINDDFSFNQDTEAISSKSDSKMRYRTKVKRKDVKYDAFKVGTEKSFKIVDIPEKDRKKQILDIYNEYLKTWLNSDQKKSQNGAHFESNLIDLDEAEKPNSTFQNDISQKEESRCDQEDNHDIEKNDSAPLFTADEHENKADSNGFQDLWIMGKSKFINCSKPNSVSHSDAIAEKNLIIVPIQENLPLGTQVTDELVEIAKISSTSGTAFCLSDPKMDSNYTSKIENIKEVSSIPLEGLQIPFKEFPSIDSITTSTQDRKASHEFASAKHFYSEKRNAELPEKVKAPTKFTARMAIKDKHRKIKDWVSQYQGVRSSRSFSLSIKSKSIFTSGLRRFHTISHKEKPSKQEGKDILGLAPRYLTLNLSTYQNDEIFNFKLPPVDLEITDYEPDTFYNSQYIEQYFNIYKHNTKDRSTSASTMSSISSINSSIDNRNLEEEIGYSLRPWLYQLDDANTIFNEELGSSSVSEPNYKSLSKSFVSDNLQSSSLSSLSSFYKDSPLNSANAFSPYNCSNISSASTPEILQGYEKEFEKTEVSPYTFNDINTVMEGNYESHESQTHFSNEYLTTSSDDSESKKSYVNETTVQEKSSLAFWGAVMTTAAVSAMSSLTLNTSKKIPFSSDVSVSATPPPTRSISSKNISSYHLNQDRFANTWQNTSPNLRQSSYTNHKKTLLNSYTNDHLHILDDNNNIEYFYSDPERISSMMTCYSSNQECKELDTAATSRSRSYFENRFSQLYYQKNYDYSRLATENSNVAEEDTYNPGTGYCKQLESPTTKPGSISPNFFSSDVIENSNEFSSTVIFRHNNTTSNNKSHEPQHKHQFLPKESKMPESLSKIEKLSIIKKPNITEDETHSTDYIEISESPNGNHVNTNKSRLNHEDKIATSGLKQPTMPPFNEWKNTICNDIPTTSRTYLIQDKASNTYESSPAIKTSRSNSLTSGGLMSPGSIIEKIRKYQEVASNFNGSKDELSYLEDGFPTEINLKRKHQLALNNRLNPSEIALLLEQQHLKKEAIQKKKSQRWKQMQENNKTNTTDCLDNSQSNTLNIGNKKDDEPDKLPDIVGIKENPTIDNNYNLNSNYKSLESISNANKITISEYNDSPIQKSGVKNKNIKNERESRASDIVNSERDRDKDSKI